MRIIIINLGNILQQNVDIDSLNVETGHCCDNCKYLILDNAVDVFNNLASPEKSLSKRNPYIAGYIICKDSSADIDDNIDYYNTFGMFQGELHRGKLAIPPYSTCQCIFFLILY